MNGFESLLFISNCVDINIVALHVMITIILRRKKSYEKPNLQAVLAISIFDDVNLYQGKWWWAAMMATTYQVWSYSLPLTPAPSLSCLKQGLAPASPSCLGGGWSSVDRHDICQNFYAADILMSTNFTQKTRKSRQ